MRPAVFLDRDGVLNPNVRNPENGMYESPHRVEDFTLYPGVPGELQRLQTLGYRLFLVSNQPSYAKGKISLDVIKAIHEKMHQILIAADIRFTEYYYCYHHPDGVVAEWSHPCECRKPATGFLRSARADHGITLRHSWVIGDRDTDIQMGRTMDVRTILIRADHPGAKQGQSRPDYTVDNLAEAVTVIEKSGILSGNQETLS